MFEDKYAIYLTTKSLFIFPHNIAKSLDLGSRCLCNKIILQFLGTTCAVCPLAPVAALHANFSYDSYLTISYPR